MTANHDTHSFLLPAFLAAINDIGCYGFKKYSVNSFQARRLSGDNSRGNLQRNHSSVIAAHARAHFEDYLSHKPHDHFHDELHQLAAVAFNAMMEAYFAGLLPEENNPTPPSGHRLPIERLCRECGAQPGENCIISDIAFKRHHCIDYSFHWCRYFDPPNKGAIH